MNKVDFIKSQAVFNDLTSEELELIADHLRLRIYESGSYIIREDELFQNLYFIERGEAEVVKLNKETRREFIIGELHQGDMFGEMAFVDAQPRSSSVRVIHGSAIVYEFSVDWDNAQMVPVYEKVLEKTVQVGVSRLRMINRDYVQNLKQQIKDIQEQNLFGYFFIFVVTIYNLSNLARYFISFDIKECNPFSLIGFSLFLFLPTVIFLHYYMNYALVDFGVTFHGVKNTLKEVFSISIIGVLIAAIISIVWTGSLQLGNFFSYLFRSCCLLSPIHLLTILLYIFSLEFTVRGAIQTSLQRFLYIPLANGNFAVVPERQPPVLKDRAWFNFKQIGTYLLSFDLGALAPSKILTKWGYSQRSSRAVLLTATMMWPTSLPLGLDISFIKFLTDIFLGALFIRQKNLIGVVILHFLFVVFTRY